jgi:hypothetical protein
MQSAVDPYESCHLTMTNESCHSTMVSACMAATHQFRRCCLLTAHAEYTVQLRFKNKESSSMYTLVRRYAKKRANLGHFKT